jgi:hypothetical protein
MTNAEHYVQSLRYWADTEFSEGGCQWCALYDAAQFILNRDMEIRTLKSFAWSAIPRKGSKREAMKRPQRRFSPKGESLVRRMRPIGMEYAAKGLNQQATTIGKTLDLLAALSPLPQGDDT